MDQQQVERDRERSEIRSRSYQNLMAYPEWTAFVKDLQEVIAAHKDASIRYSAQNKPFDAQRQASIVEGIEEALGRPQYVIDYHNSFYKRMVRKVCAMCGQVALRIQNSFVGSTGK